MELNNQINNTVSEIKKKEDDLVLMKQCKNFLDTLAISAGKKKFNPKKKQEQKSNLVS
jgi:hypothetical protein